MKLTEKNIIPGKNYKIIPRKGKISSEEKMINSSVIT